MSQEAAALAQVETLNESMKQELDTLRHQVAEHREMQESFAGEKSAAIEMAVGQMREELEVDFSEKQQLIIQDYDKEISSLQNQLRQ